MKFCRLSTSVVEALTALLFCARRETLRRDPVVQMLFRVALRDFELSGYSVPAGKQLLLPLKYLSAHDPRWEDATGEWSPDAFVPERMLTPEGLKAGDLMPFGYGSRWAGFSRTSAEQHAEAGTWAGPAVFCSSASARVSQYLSQGSQQGLCCSWEVPTAPLLAGCILASKAF